MSESMRTFREGLLRKEEENRSADDLANEVLETVIPQNKVLARVRSDSGVLQTAGVLTPSHRRSSDPPGTLVGMDKLDERGEISKMVDKMRETGELP